ncbi:MAG: exodeoxyribonuclease VII small subunit [Chloroflexi bacterium]|nr:exodeoxyribonuclease VII small subunit [Chloroflexota bacterium]
MNDISALSFEAAFEELEALIGKLDGGDLGLEESVTLFERARALADHCQNLLDKAELRVKQLSDSGRVEDVS